MVTITAPGIEINEIDLSQYEIQRPVDETQNVLVFGFASKGLFNVPYEFSKKNVDNDLIETFGIPTNEAERYFYNTCLEIIRRDKVKLYAIRLPYDPEVSKYNYTKYQLVTEGATIQSELKEISNEDQTLANQKICQIKQIENNVFSEDVLAKYRQSIEKPGSQNFIIVDKTQTVYNKIPVDSKYKTAEECSKLGIIPVVTTAANALYAQKLISCDIQSRLSTFESIADFKTILDDNEIDQNYLVYPASSKDLDPDNKNAITVSQLAAKAFPTIQMNQDGSFDRDRLKDIGVVVFKTKLDPEYNNKINFIMVEAFAGSLKANEINPYDGSSKFIDDVINTNSKYIEFYSNCFNADLTYTVANTAKNGNTTNQTHKISYDDIGILKIKDNTSGYILGFKQLNLEDKKISTDKILSSIDKSFEKCKNVNTLQLDLIVDAGVSNIAQFMSTVNIGSQKWLEYYDITKIDGKTNKSAVELWKLTDPYNASSKITYTNKWQLVLKKFDDFCKSRKDCMFIADGLRPLCVVGNSKRVIDNNYKTTIDNTIIPDIKALANKINTSYGAGYCDWYKIIDPTTGLGMWMPPSSKIVLVYLDTTNTYDYWTVPAGINYGKLNDSRNPNLLNVVDIAFNPTVQEAGNIYTKQWNYMQKYSDVGFVVEGQKTFQIQQTAFDRVNVRRLFLYLEKKVYNASRYFIYQGNTAYTRQKLVDSITPYFEDAKIRGGLFDYRIQCDENNNTPETIDANELHIKIAIKPTKAIEFIECSFIALKTGASFTEIGMEE